MIRPFSLVMRVALAVCLTAYMSFASAVPVQAAGDNPYALQHLFDCMGLAFTDPAKHLAECGQGITDSGPFYHSPNSNVITPPPACGPISDRQLTRDPSVILVGQSCCLPGSFRMPKGGAPSIVPVINCCQGVNYEGGPLSGDPSIIPVTCCTTSYREPQAGDPMVLPVDCA